MNILGIFLILVLPFTIGVIFNFITRQKRTNQIETYLIGFFSFFLIQGVIFSLHNFANVPYETCCRILVYFSYAALAIGVVIGIAGFKNYVLWDIKKLLLKKEESVVFGIMMIAVAVVVARVAL